MAWCAIMEDGKTACYSTEWEHLASFCGSDPTEFALLLHGSSHGRWPCSVAGRLIEVNLIPMPGEGALLTAGRLERSAAVTMLDTIRGNRKTLLCTSSGRLAACSSQVPQEMDRDAKTLQSLFEPGSRPAVQAALKRCMATGRVDDFLVASGGGHGNRENWVLSMEAVPAPGRLVLCDLSAPSLALVSTGGNTDSLLKTIIEENPSPALVVDKSGVITQLNHAAGALALELYGEAGIQGTFFWKWVAEEYREEAKNNHDRRVRGYHAPDRYTIGLKTDLLNRTPLMEIRVFPLAEGGDSVAFLANRFDSRSECSFPESEAFRLPGSIGEPGTFLPMVKACTGSDSAALILPGQVHTTGDAAELVREAPPEPGPRTWSESDGSWRMYQSVEWGSGTGTLALGGLRTNGLRPCGELALGMIPGFWSHAALTGLHGGARTALEQVSRIVELAGKGREGVEKALRELAVGCSADRAVKAQVSSDGTMLLPVATMGVQGVFPGFPTGSDNIMAWVSVHGRSAYLADPISDVRMSSVFPDSGSEMAAPIIRGELVTGVLLLATSATEGFDSDSMALLETAAKVLSVLEASSRAESRAEDLGSGTEQLPEAVITELEAAITAEAALLARAAGQFSRAPEEAGAKGELASLISGTAERMASSSSVLMAWLRAAAFGGKPDMRWSDPYDTVAELVAGWRRDLSGKHVEVCIHEPEQRFIACFDPSWLHIALNSLFRVAAGSGGAHSMVSVSLLNGSGFWSIQVETSGEGISASTLPDLFRHRAGSGDQKGIRGAGLDLPLAKRFTEAMGGTVTLFSTKDRGSRFTLRFKSS